VRLGTRGSALALAQARLVARLLEGVEPGLTVELVEITTSGDRGSPVGDKSRFVKEIEEALLAGEIDIAVHSAKDVPGVLPDGLGIVGVPEREDARDALCGVASLDDLPAGASVGTSSLRRRAQLLAERPDLEVTDLRGNVDTRLRKLAEGSHDAVVLAMAGLKRLGRADAGVPLPPDLLTPAPGQGCLALEARRDDDRAAELAGRVTDAHALTCLTAERAVVETLEATCHTPVAAYATLDGSLELSAFAGLPEGSTWIRDSLSGDPGDPGALGREVADRLLSAGAAELLALRSTA
jgi:hydroxymethylbilane synthase